MLSDAEDLASGRDPAESQELPSLPRPRNLGTQDREVLEPSNRKDSDPIKKSSDAIVWQVTIEPACSYLYQVAISTRSCEQRNPLRDGRRELTAEVSALHGITSNDIFCRGNKPTELFQLVSTEFRC
ncbi:hypothetical protein J6590_020247 [Homalodisca vitripennis]|nr:hypothetical protein J6590_020247 [Homalodisca vitripennis]